MNSQKHVAVIGAGLVGCSSALWLQRKGFRVTLIDRDDPGAGTSSGNACTIATYGCIPVNSPDIFRRLPALLFSADSPLSLDPFYVLRHPGWSIDFLRNCRKHRVEHIIEQLGGLLAKTWDGLDPLLDMAEARDLVAQNNFMHVYRDQDEFDRVKAANQLRREQGARFRELDRADIRELEPNLKIDFQRGLLFDGISHVLDPRKLCERYVDCLQRNHGQFLRRRVIGVESGENPLRIELDDGAGLEADFTVIAAGAFSRDIAGLPKMKKIKLDTERGYHVQFSGMQQLLSRPVSWHHAGFYAVPMNLGMRFAGMVEIAGYHDKRNPRIIDYLTRRAREMLDLPERPDQQWLGFRPTCPDSLPVIGFGPGSRSLLYAFGHHHLGLTLSGITGKLIAELANGEQPGHNMGPFSPDRFL